MTIKNAMVYENKKFVSKDFNFDCGAVIPDFNNLVVLPAFCDVHVHYESRAFHIRKQF